MRYSNDDQTLLVTGDTGVVGGDFVRHPIGMAGARVVKLDGRTSMGNLDTLVPILYRQSAERLDLVTKLRFVELPFSLLALGGCSEPFDKEGAAVV